MIRYFPSKGLGCNYRHISQPETGVFITSQSGTNTMTKSQRSNREAKKQALLTPKEKKAAKRLKKHTGDATPLIVKPS